MDYWPNWEDNGCHGPIRKKWNSGLILSLKYEVNPQWYGCYVPVLDIWASCYSTTLSSRCEPMLSN